MIRYALIGCGRISPNHIAAVAANMDVLQICAVCDVIPERCEKVLEMLPEKQRINIHQYTDYHVMLQCERPQLVAIATESGNHAFIGLDCIRSGCNIIVEKPIALSLKDADALIAAAKENNVLLCTNHQNRFNKSVRKIHEAISKGQFGKLLYGTAQIRWARDKGYYDQAPWRGTWMQDGGCLMNQCIHCIDLLRWLMGDDVDEVTAYTDRLTHDYIEGEDFGIALVKFRNGSYGIIEGTVNVYPHNLEETLTLFGQHGTVKAGGKSVNVIEEWFLKDDLEDADTVKRKYSEYPPNIYGFGHTQLYKDVIDAILNNRSPFADGVAGKRALEMVLAIYKSAKEGRAIKLPLDNYSTLDMTGFFDN